MKGLASNGETTFNKQKTDGSGEETSTEHRKLTLTETSLRRG
jgi:hypothetical protein